ncbi:MAG TPA: SMI1/KNR4 family protein, partial [Burkholderiales bacterium]|nr:SMI1/KNR4 family protein [Burkholderiales bacterium]
ASSPSSPKTEDDLEKKPESWLAQLNAFTSKGINFFHDACSEADIAKVEAVCSRALPEQYRQFLAHTGRGSDLFFIGEEIFFPDLLAFGQRARRLLAKDSAPCSLPEDAFVFFIHQDMQFLYFRLSAGEDPAVYGYDQGARKFILMHESFSDFMRAFIKIHAESYGTLAHIYAPMLSLVSETISHPANKLPGMGMAVSHGDFSDAQGGK